MRDAEPDNTRRAPLQETFSLCLCPSQAEILLHSFLC